MDETTAAIFKALGAAGGAFLSLVYLPPKTVRDFLIRSVFSFISGVLFGEPTREQYLRWPGSWIYVLAASAIVALASWFAWGMAVRVLSKWMPTK